MRHILRWKGLLAFLGAFTLLTQAAGAHHATFDFTLSNYSTNAYANSTSTTTFGSYRAASMEIELPDGWRVAQQTGTTPISPIPNDGDVIGTGSATARWAPFCTSSTMTLTPRWESTISASAPANTVAQVNVSSTLFITEAFIVRNGTNDYDIVVPDMPDTFVCSSTTNGSMTLTIHGTVSGSNPTRYVAQNPATAGTYTANMSYVDTAGTTHTGSDSVTIS